MSLSISMKKNIMMAVVALLLLFMSAMSASAATFNYQFLDENENYSPHASSFIVQDAVFSNDTATIVLEDNTTIGDLLVWDGSDYVEADRSVNSSGNVQFTFAINDLNENLAIQLFVNAGPHSGYIPLFIEWL